MVLLIADDKEVILKGLLSIDWSSMGFDTILSARNGLEAIDYLKEGNVDIMISDIRMPGLTGLQLSEYIQSASLETIIILLTGYSEFDYAKRAVRYDVYDYLLKPIKPNELINCVMAAKTKIEKERYKTQVFEEYAKKARNYKTIERIIYDFRDVDTTVFEILKYMAENYQDDLSLNLLAEKFHFSPVYLSRLIKKETGYSFSDILTCIRLLNALELLQKNKYKIQEVCENVGFKDQRYFSQVFRKIFNCKPSEYCKDQEKHYKYAIKEILNLKAGKKENKYEMEEGYVAATKINFHM